MVPFYQMYMYQQENLNIFALELLNSAQGFWWYFAVALHLLNYNNVCKVITGIILGALL